VTVPIVAIGRSLVVAIQEDLDDEAAQALETRVASEVGRRGARGLVLDVSNLTIVDSFVARILDRIVGLVRLQGASAVVVGVRPSVAITLVELGLSLVNVPTALDADRGLRLLQELEGDGRRVDGDG